jgi:DNA-binding response OmpR family regulator
MSLTILHVEDDRVVADAIKETLEEQGWNVVSCYDGSIALNRLATQDVFDLLILDNKLPGASGEEIAKYARSLPHCQKTPIIMLSGSFGIGGDVFLRKPEDIGRLVETVIRLTG